MTRSLRIAVLAAAACLWSAAASAQEHDAAHPIEHGPGPNPFADVEAYTWRLDALGWNRVGVASAGKHDWVASRKAFERAVKLAPQNLDAHVGLALALQALNDPGARQQSEWLKSRAQACGNTCPDAARLEALERAGFFSAT